MARKMKHSKNQSSIKGKILEMVVAGLHEAPNIKVDRNVRLLSLRNPKRKREIDVLVSGMFSGYPVRIAIECKNHKNTLDVEYIDAFIGKLGDVGIPTQQGIFVSPKVIGLQISISGKVTEHVLLDPMNQKVNKFKTTISFDNFQGKHPIVSFFTERDLQDFLMERAQKAKLTVGRIRLPRIRFHSLYWPLSERAVTEFAALVAYCQKQGRKPTDEEISSIEGNDLTTIWEPVWSENPLLPNNKTQNDRK